MFKFNNGNTEAMCEIWKVNNKDTKTTILRRSGVFIVNVEQILQIVLVFPFDFGQVNDPWEKLTL